jgi:hypothetical protein
MTLKNPHYKLQKNAKIAKAFMANNSIKQLGKSTFSYKLYENKYKYFKINFTCII